MERLIAYSSGIDNIDDVCGVDISDPRGKRDAKDKESQHNLCYLWGGKNCSETQNKVWL